jgi:hypothetical protein
MKKKYFLLSLSALLITSLVGCGNNNSQPAETESSEVSESIESTETSETEEPVDNSVEYVVVVDSIDEKGILCYPYDNTCELWDIDDKFYINAKDIITFKNDKTSIYDIIYFYDGLVIKYDGTYEAKSEYSNIIPKEGTKISVNLLEEYKTLNIDNNEDRDETPIDIIDKDDNKADLIYSGLFCKFEYPAKYKDIIVVKERNSGKDIYTEVFYVYNDNGKNETMKLFSVEKITLKQSTNIPDNKISYINSFNLYVSENYMYNISYNKQNTFTDITKELVDYIYKNIVLVE